MSRNDQLLVKEYKGKFYVFDVMAESWGGFKDQPINHLDVSEAIGVADTRADAHRLAYKYDLEDEMGGSEYGVVDDLLYKDGADVTITDQLRKGRSK